jgi:two-component system catabolic regulation response regulator CreB
MWDCSAVPVSHDDPIPRNRVSIHLASVYAHARRLEPHRVTIVEDDENIAGLLMFLLQREGFAPELVRDGRAAIEHVARNGPPAAVVLDHLLPYRDGHAVASAMRADPRWSDVPILLLSAAQADVEPGPGDARVDACIEKPFDPSVLVTWLKRLTREAA